MITLFNYSSEAIVGAVFVLMFLLFYVGSAVFHWWKKRVSNAEETTFGAVQGSLLGLLALLLSFTFSMSSGHYDRRVDAIRDEANAIGTAILRADLYPDSMRQLFRKDFREYLETRIEFFEAGVDMARVQESLKQRQIIQDRLWARAASVAREPGFLVPSNQMIPALNAVFDVVTTRNMALLKRVPDIILWVLILLCLMSAFTLGYSEGRRLDWILNLGFAFMIAMTLYLVIDLDRSRRGIINTSFATREIVNLRSMFSSTN